MDDIGGAGGRILAPERVDQLGEGDHRSVADQQQCEHESLLTTTEINFDVTTPGTDRAEDSETHNCHTPFIPRKGPTGRPSLRRSTPSRAHYETGRRRHPGHQSRDCVGGERDSNG
ncbi:hypothetical protein Jiend_52000 [Micromonospora endophytica]|nr:hypothetical protein Jiend_52000 [Micromonospora endophytica]